MISKDDRVKYFEFLKNNDIANFSSFLNELSKNEEERMIKFGFKK